MAGTKNDYAYAVARLRAIELKLLNAGDYEKLLGCQTIGECMALLEERGWNIPPDEEKAKTWSLISELTGELTDFSVLLLKNDYHNIKAAIKAVYTDTKRRDIYLPAWKVDADTALNAVMQQDFSALPETMRSSAEEAISVFRETGDGQLSEIILDKAALTAIWESGSSSGIPALQDCAEIICAEANVKTAVRAARMKKNREFIERALAPCATLNAEMLTEAALEGLEAIEEYLLRTEYRDAAALVSGQSFELERWFDDRLTDKLKAEKMNPFTVGPLIAYVVARENEIRNVRIILSSKRNGIGDDLVRERLRKSYV